ncbi:MULTISPECIES: NUDIX hydrolase [Chitinophagaceae]
MTDNHTLATAGLVVVQNNQLLLAYSKRKNAWYLPGGKVDKGETSLEAVIREVREELSIELDPTRLQYYCHTTAPAYGEANNFIMEQDCFSYELNETINPSNEILAVRYFSFEDYIQEPAQVIGVLNIFERLKKDSLIMD